MLFVCFNKPTIIQLLFLKLFNYYYYNYSIIIIKIIQLLLLQLFNTITFLSAIISTFLWHNTGVSILKMSQ